MTCSMTVNSNAPNGSAATSVCVMQVRGYMATTSSATHWRPPRTPAQRVRETHSSAHLRGCQTLQQVVLQLLEGDRVAGELGAEARRLLLQVRPLVCDHLPSACHTHLPSATMQPPQQLHAMLCKWCLLELYVQRAVLTDPKVVLKISPTPIAALQGRFRSRRS